MAVTRTSVAARLHIVSVVPSSTPCSSPPGEGLSPVAGGEPGPPVAGAVPGPAPVAVGLVVAPCPQAVKTRVATTMRTGNLKRFIMPCSSMLNQPASVRPLVAGSPGRG
jgi:hypothetical protein